MTNHAGSMAYSVAIPQSCFVPAGDRNLQKPAPFFRPLSGALHASISCGPCKTGGTLPRLSEPMLRWHDWIPLEHSRGSTKQVQPAPKGNFNAPVLIRVFLALA